MAADAAGNDTTAVFIPVTGFVAFAAYGTPVPTKAELNTYGYTPPVTYARGGLITVDGGAGWNENRASNIEFFQDEYEVNAGTGSAEFSVKLAETNTNVRTILRGVAPDGNNAIDVDIDANVHYVIYVEEVAKNGDIRRRVSANAWLTAATGDKSTRGEVSANQATFKCKRHSATGNNHFTEVIVPLDATPAPYITSILPSGAAVGADVLVRGAYLGTSGADISAFTIDGVSVAVKTWIDANNVLCTIPAAVSGAASTILTTTSGGASNTYAYVAA